MIDNDLDSSWHVSGRVKDGGGIEWSLAGSRDLGL